MTKILLVEDDKSLREIYGVRLLAEGYDIISAGDGEEALAMAIKERPALIVSDVMMPKISGFDMLDILRSTTETREIKVIMMTALSSEDQRKRGEQLGADRYLVKSQVGIEDVVRTVHEVLTDSPAAPAPMQQTAPSAPAPQPQPAAPVQSPMTDRASVPVTPRPVDAVPQQPPAPMQQTAPSAPAPQPQPAAPVQSPLPQPTAPFSTSRPNSLASRVIEPITAVDASSQSPEVADLIQKELETFTPQSQTPTEQPEPPVQPQTLPPPPAPPTGLTDAAEVSYVETPRPQTPQPPQTQ
jgi:CheY-like chemotaxis protein